MELVLVECLLMRESDFDVRRNQLPRHYNQSLVVDPAAGRALMFCLLLICKSRKRERENAICNSGQILL
ncbi:MAG: hypothetical protein JWO38_5951 [Gemmataceae bacterium]|nr:hypothetical protein [Gemmataceae bacterium]